MLLDVSLKWRYESDCIQENYCIVLCAAGWQGSKSVVHLLGVRWQQASTWREVGVVAGVTSLYLVPAAWRHSHSAMAMRALGRDPPSTCGQRRRCRLDRPQQVRLLVQVSKRYQWLISLYLVGAACFQWKIGGSFVKGQQEARRGRGLSQKMRGLSLKVGGGTCARFWL